MFSYLWLLFKRFALLIPGIIVAFFSAHDVFPYIHRRLPGVVAILITYIIGAYLLVPAILRGWHILFPAQHLPLYSVTPDGHASDPLNIGLLGSRKQLIGAMETIGWHTARPSTVRTISATIWSLLLNRPYDGMPMSRLYLFGRKQDISFELQVPNEGRGHRHHVRFWATTLADIQDIETLRVRHPGKQAQYVADSMLWAGAASLDNGITLMRQSLQFAHAVASDTNAERDFIAHRLEGSGLAMMVSVIRLHAAYKLVNRTWFAFLGTDGKMTILRLKN